MEKTKQFISKNKTVLAIIFTGICILVLVNFAQERYRDEQMAKITKQFHLDTCLSEADDSYYLYAEINGNINNEGIITAPQYVWDIAEKNKRIAIEDCYRRFNAR